MPRPGPNTPPIFDNNLTTPVSADYMNTLLDDAYDQAVRDAPGITGGPVANFIDVTKNGVVEGGGAGVANLNALNGIIDNLPGVPPAASNTVIYFPPGVYDIQGVLTPIINTNVMVTGAGMGATVLRQTAASTTGRFFTIGQVNAGATPDIRPGRVTVRDMSLQCMNTPQPGGTLPSVSPAFYIQGASNWTIENIHVSLISQFLRIGIDEGDEENAHGGYVNNIVGTLADTGVGIAGTYIVQIHRAASTILQNMELHVAGGTNDGFSWLIDPRGGQDPGTPNAVEGLRVNNCSVWSFNRSGGLGQSACLRVNIDNGSCVNMWFSNCSFDFADLATVHIYCPSTAAEPGYCRYLKLTDCYLGGMGAGDGNRFRITADHPDCFVMSSTLNNCMMAMDTGVAVYTTGAGIVKDTQVNHCQFIDKDTTVNKPACVSMAHGDFTLIGNVARGFDENGLDPEATAMNTDYFVHTREDVNLYTVIGNRGFDLNTGFFNHFGYVTQLHTTQGRIVRDNYPIDYPSVASAATLNLPPHAEAVSVTGSTTITAIRGPAGRPITLVFTVGAAVTEGANIQLSAAFTAGANKTLTLMSNNGQNWWEVARSVN